MLLQSVEMVRNAFLFSSETLGRLLDFVKHIGLKNCHYVTKVFSVSSHVLLPHPYT